jgi:hypothetical protein
MMKALGRREKIALAVIVAAIVIAAFFLATRPVSAPPDDALLTPQPEPLVNTFDRSPTGFSFQYPDGWTYQIPFQGVLLAGLPESLDNTVPGPIFAVQRGLTLNLAGSLSGAIEMYLQDGPLRTDAQWQVTVPEADTTVDGRPARVVELEGAEQGGTPSHTRIIATAADNTLIYLFIITAPLTDAAQYRPTFDAMLASVEIFE